MKKIIVFIFFLFIFTRLISVIPTVKAWDPTDPKLQESMTEAHTNDGIALPTTVVNTLFSNFGGLTCGMAGDTSCATGPIASKYSNFGLIKNVQSANVAMMFNQPASSTLWIADVGQQLGFIPKSAYAQGVGFSGLSPILNLWKTFRNLAYVIIALIMVVIGFMIMFRTKIDPHTVATVQLALPRVIVTLIMITFSYALVALFIDLSYVIIFLSYNLFRTAGLPALIPASITFGIQVPTAPYNTQQVFLSGNLFQTLGVVFPNGFSDFGSLFTKLTGIGLDVATAAQGAVIGGAIGGLIGGPPGLVGGGVVGAAAPILIQFLIALLISILVIRIFFLFLGAYIQILLRTILGPILLVMGAIPGQNATSSWLRAIISNLSVFVVSGIMFMLAATFNAVFQTDAPQAIWAPPYFPFSLNSGNISAFFVIGILMLIPTIAGQIRQGIQGDGQQIGMGGAIFGGLTGVTSLGMQAFNMWRSEHHNRQIQSAISGKNDSHGGAEHGK